MNLKCKVVLNGRFYHIPRTFFGKLEKEKKVTIVNCNNKVKEREGEIIFLCEFYAECAFV